MGIVPAIFRVRTDVTRAFYTCVSYLEDNRVHFSFEGEGLSNGTDVIRAELVYFDFPMPFHRNDTVNATVLLTGHVTHQNGRSVEADFFPHQQLATPGFNRSFVVFPRLVSASYGIIDMMPSPFFAFDRQDILVRPGTSMGLVSGWGEWWLCGEWLIGWLA